LQINGDEATTQHSAPQLSACDIYTKTLRISSPTTLSRLLLYQINYIGFEEELLDAKEV